MKNVGLFSLALILALVVTWPFARAVAVARACGWEALFVECRIVKQP